MKRSLRRLVSLATSSILISPQLLLLSVQSTQAQTAQGETGCPAGTFEASTNSIFNGDFAISPGVVGAIPAGNPAGFTSGLPYRGDARYPDDAGNSGGPPQQPLGGLSIQNGPLTDPLTPGVVNGRGVSAAEAANAGVAPVNTYLYSNPNASATNPFTPTSAFDPNPLINPIVWRQVITGLQPNTTYNFKALFFNLLVNQGAPGSNGVPPIIVLNVGAPGAAPTIQSTPFAVGSEIAQGAVSAAQNTRQAWIPVQFAFSTGPGQTSVELQIEDRAENVFGDDFGVTAIGLRQCVPRIGVAKAVGTPTQNPNGSYTVPYTVTVRNYGPANATGDFGLSNVQLTENLATTFANARINAVTNVQSPTLTVNPNFNGTTDQNLLLPGANALAAQTTATVTFNVNVSPSPGPGGSGPFNNTVQASALGEGGIPTSDTSIAGTDPDPDGNSNPNEVPNNVPTAVTLPFIAVPNIGVSKQVGTVVNNGDGTYNVPYTVLVQNTGNVTLTNVQLVDNLFGSPTSTFNGVTSFEVVTPPAITSGSLTAPNPAFNGNTDQNLLAGTESLTPGQRATVTFTVRVNPGANLGPYNNTATATGRDPNGATVSDVSTDQTGQSNPSTDPDGDGNPSNNSVPTVVNFAALPGTTGPTNFRVVKRITNALRNGSPLPAVNFNTFVDDPGSDEDNLPGWGQLSPLGAPIGIVSLPDTNPVQFGDVVEYTVYFLADGGNPALAVNLCDLIPSGTTLVPDTARVSLANSNPASGGTVFTPLAPLPAGNSCPDQVNPNGAVIFELGDVSNSPGRNFGFVRFRVRVSGGS